MKYCTKCGNLLNENSRFCNKCGNPTRIVLKEREELKKIKNEENKEKLLLLLGTILIIIASVVFAVINWEEMTNIFKVLFLLMEALVFLSLSMFSKKLNYKMPHKFLWFIGIIFLPIILSLLPEYDMIGDFSKGNTLYVYLALSSVFCFSIYVLSYKFIKSNVFLYFGYIFIYSFITNILCLLGFTTLNYVIPVLNIFNLAMCIFYTYIKNDIINTTIKRFLSVSLIIFSIFTSAFLNQYKTSINDIILLITSASVIISIFIILFRNKNNVPIYFYPLCIFGLIVSLSASIFTNFENVALFLSVLGILFTYFIMAIKEDKAFNIVSYIFMILYLIFTTSVYSNENYNAICIISIIILISLIFTFKINEKNSPQNYITKLIIPLNIFIIVYSLINSFILIDITISLFTSSVICFITHIIINKKNNDTYFSYTLSITSYILLGISSFIILITHSNILFFIINEVLWLIYFIYNSIIKNNKIINIILLTLSILNFIILGYEYSINIYYSLLFVSFLTLILDVGLMKQNKKTSPFIYISIITSSLASICDLNNMLIIGIGSNVLIYVLTYYIINKKRNINIVIKYIYTIIGFILINSIFHYFIDKILFASILVLVVYLIILICMYLLRTMSDRKVFGLYAIIIIPYINILNNVDISNTYYVSFNLLLFVSLIFIYFEKVMDIKEKDKIVFELVLLSLAHLFTINTVFVLDLFLSAFYLFYAIYKKRDAFVIFGLVLLVISILINIWKMIDNLSVTFALMIVGFVMLGYVFYLEGKKRKKNNNE